MEWLALSLGALGAVSGITGSLYMANGYFPFRLKDFAAHTLRVLWRRIRYGRKKALDSVKATVELGERVGEQKHLSLFGLYLVFTGFVLEFAGLLAAGVSILAK